MRNQDPRGRRGQPLQVREPLPGAQDQDEESRRMPAGAPTSPEHQDLANKNEEQKICGSKPRGMWPVGAMLARVPCRFMDLETSS